jgi:FkbM family methyltransferase
MIKKVFNFLFKTSSAEKKLLLKDIFFTNENENITRLCRLVHKTPHLNFENKRIIDIGAYDGKTSIIFSRKFPTNKIVAFEANPETYKLALKNCSNNLNITVKNNAISDKNQQLTFYITSNDVSSSFNNINVEEVNSNDYKNDLTIKNELSVNAQTLDENFKNEKILVLKIDTQGHELEVLEGATATLKNTDFVLIEMSNHNMYVNGCKYYQVDERMRNNNFKLVDIIVTYRKKGMIMTEYDAIYANNKLELG